MRYFPLILLGAQLCLGLPRQQRQEDVEVLDSARVNCKVTAVVTYPSTTEEGALPTVECTNKCTFKTENKDQTYFVGYVYRHFDRLEKEYGLMLQIRYNRGANADKSCVLVPATDDEETLATHIEGNSGCTMTTILSTTLPTTLPPTTVSTTPPRHTEPWTTVPTTVPVTHDLFTTFGTTLPPTTMPTTLPYHTEPSTLVPTTVPITHDFFTTTQGTTLPPTTTSTMLPYDTEQTTVPTTTTVPSTTISTTMPITHDPIPTTLPTTLPPTTIPTTMPITHDTTTLPTTLPSSSLDWFGMLCTTSTTTTLPPTTTTEPTTTTTSTTTTLPPTTTTGPTTTTTSTTTTLPQTTTTEPTTTTTSTTTTLATTTSWVCGSDWVLIGTACFHLSEVRGDWSEGRDYCAGLGATLASIRSQEEQDGLAGLIDDNAWIGLHDMHSEGAHLWEDQTALSYSNWEPGQPDNSGTFLWWGSGEDCVEMNLGYSLRWNDEDCDSENIYICRRDAELQG